MAKKKVAKKRTTTKDDENAIQALAKNAAEEGDEEAEEVEAEEVEGEETPEEVVHTDVNAIDKVLALIIDELQKRFDDRVPVAVLKLLLPTITKLINAGELDVKVRLQVQARIDDALRKLGMI